LQVILSDGFWRHLVEKVLKYLLTCCLNLFSHVSQNVKNENVIKLHFESRRLKCVCRYISKKMSFKMKNSIYFYRLFDFDRKRRKGPPNVDDRPEFI
jgi:hypothetical protein